MDRSGGRVMRLGLTRTFAALVMVLACMAGVAWAETCQYNTPWGVLTLRFNYDNDTFAGEYPHKNGQVVGVLAPGDAGKGQWAQSDGSGSLWFKFHDRGFNGKWNYAADKDWRGDWNGKLIKCWRD